MDYVFNILAATYPSLKKGSLHYFAGSLHAYNDDLSKWVIFCPGCSRILTGLHMDSKCYFDWIEKKAQQILKNSKKRHVRRK